MYLFVNGSSRRHSESISDQCEAQPDKSQQRRLSIATMPCTRRRPSYNIDCTGDCNATPPPDESPLVLSLIARRKASNPSTPTMAPVAEPPEVGPFSARALDSELLPSWTQVRAQFDFALDHISQGHSLPETMRARQSFLALWTLHALATKELQCI